VYNALTSVSADSASDAWVVGSYVNNATGVRDTLVPHWNGTPGPRDRRGPGLFSFPLSGALP